MRTIKIIVMMMTAMVAMVASAGDSAPFRLDTVVKTATSPMNDSLDVSYNAEWIGGDANATVVISDNGNEIKRAVGAGEFSYVLSGSGQHTLAYTTYIGGVAQDEVYSLPVWTTNGQIPVILNNADSTVVNHTVEAAGFADAGVNDAIGGNAAKYNAFKEWAQGVNGGESAVVANTNVAVAFLLGAERLFENAPRIEFGEVEVGGGVGGAEGTKGTISLTVTVKDGEEVVKCAAEKVKDMFEATGDLGDWDGTAKMSPTVNIESGDGETMRFNVTPGDGTASKAFLRIKVK